ncbi:thioredoxin 1 [Ardenticatena maritima]|uniref:Thioredoxin n=1 Tax=Ardenticatena maritima TaxID=872965 RepID=A0A0M8K8N5_9CHLR|nr:thioredoxin [Ardenticatena maritima]GAP63081.1 thioredoxin 1 [Ardenticatena maritima]
MNMREFEQTIKTSATPVIVDVWAPWCLPCRATKPLLEELAREYEGEVAFLAVNADESPEVARAFKVMAIPTLLIFEQGELTQRLVGAQSPGTYKTLFARLAGETSAETAATPAIAPGERLLRLGAAALLFTIALAQGVWWLGAIAAGMAFWGVYDRCPLWRTIQSRLWRA